MVSNATPRVPNRHGRPRLVTKWSVENFKSIGHTELSLEGRRLSILTGTNSVGKSSMLQSLLLLAQSEGRNGIVLNGPLVSLGFPRDIVRRGEDAVNIGVDYRSNASLRAMRDEAQFHADIELAVCSADESQEEIHVSRIRISNLKNGEDIAWFTRFGVRDALPRYVRRSMMVHGLRDEIRDTKLDEFDVTLDGSENPSDVYTVLVDGMRPVAVLRRLDEAERREIASSVLAGCIDMLWLHGRDSDYRSDLPVAYQRFYERYAAMSSSDNDAYWRSRRLSSNQLSPSQVRRLIEGNNDVDAVIAEIEESLDDALETYLSSGSIGSMVRGGLRRDDTRLFQGMECDEALSAAMTSLDALSAALGELAGSIAYIGPLREDPSVNNPLVDDPDPELPVGRKGEAAASVLLKRGESTIWARVPSEEQPGSIALQRAVDSWSAYLGVASKVRVKPLGKLGVGFTLNGEDDPTMVGVGASQAIPIVVGCLGCAGNNAIVIVEQPELHLHPSAQSKMADFFLSAMPDATFLVETHSEALITRVRRRVVEGAVRPDDVSLTFFESSSRGTSSRELRINEFGNLDAWPKGFMDAVQEDSRIIVRKAMEKKRSTHEHKH